MNSFNAFLRKDFAQPRRSVRIQTLTTSSHVLLVLEDNAGGIDGIGKSDIWLPGVTTSENGTGFGLTIVRDSVADLGGSIYVLEKSEFGGAKFTADRKSTRLNSST